MNDLDLIALGKVGDEHILAGVRGVLGELFGLVDIIDCPLGTDEIIAVGQGLFDCIVGIVIVVFGGFGIFTDRNEGVLILCGLLGGGFGRIGPHGFGGILGIRCLDGLFLTDPFDTLDSEYCHSTEKKHESKDESHDSEYEMLLCLHMFLLSFLSKDSDNAMIYS